MNLRNVGFSALCGVLVFLTACSGSEDDSASCKSTAESRVFRAVGVDPTDDSIVYVGVEGHGVYKTINSGQTWTKISSGILGAALSTGGTCYNEFRDLSISAQNSQKLCVSQSGGPLAPTEPLFGVHMGPYCSSDGGTTWTRSVTGLNDVGGYSLTVDPNNSSTVYYGVGDFTYNPGAIGSGTGVIYKSTDFGLTWTELNTNYTAGQSANRIHVHPTDPNKIFSAMAVLVTSGTGVDGGRYGTNQSGMILSTNAGSVWTSANSGMASISPLQRAITEITLSIGNPSNLFTISADSTETVRNYYSHDGGATFTASGTSQIDYAEFDPNDATGNTMLGLSYNALVRSTDGGVTWNLYGTAPTLATGKHFSVIRWSRQSSSILYLGADLGLLYRSADGGTTWTEVLSAATLPN